VNDTRIVVDASAVIALLVGERFDRFDSEQITGASISTVNLSEVLARLQQMGLPEDEADVVVTRLNLRTVPFDEAQAYTTARLRAATRRSGLSLGDRACLALGRQLGRAVVTADRAWANVDVGVEVILIR
jgi:PIN domain nuclease of toxin-antitoxin system